MSAVLIERAARAIAVSKGYEPDAKPSSIWPNEGDARVWWQVFEDDARAALSAAGVEQLRGALQYARNLIGPDEIIDGALEQALVA